MPGDKNIFIPSKYRIERFTIDHNTSKKSTSILTPVKTHPNTKLENSVLYSVHSVLSMVCFGAYHYEICNITHFITVQRATNLSELALVKFSNG